MAIGPTVPERTDILIIGGGVIGTATAFALSKRTDDDVTLVERDNVAAGATGDSSSQLRHHYYGDELYTRMALDGHRFYREFEERTGYELAHAHHLQARFGRRDADDGEKILEGYEVLSSLSVSVSMYEDEEIPATFPLLKFADGVDFAVTDDSAGYTDGADAASGLANAAADRGARIVTGVAVESIETNDDAVVGVETEHGFVECQMVIVAAGPWSHKVTRTAGVDLPIAPSREQVLLLDPPDDVTEEELQSLPMHVMESPRGRTWYMRRDFDGGVLLATHFRSDPVDPDAYSNQTDEEIKLEAFELLSEHVPKLAGSDLVGDFCGVYANTPDEGFIIDQVGPVGCYALVGAGHALKHGPIIGQLAADLILEGASDRYDLDRFSIDRFGNRSPNWPLESDRSAESTPTDSLDDGAD